MSTVDLPAYVTSLAVAILAGGAIGLEREWRGHAAGLRTHILVCVSSALLMEAAVSQASWRFAPLAGTEIVSDPTRMAHGILTGIGFLCAGVIFRSGFTVHGLTTAASLWTTSAVGILVGVGLARPAITATALTLAVLIGLRMLGRLVPTRVITDLEVAWRGPDADVAVQRIIEDADPGFSLTLRQLEPETGLTRRCFVIKTSDKRALTTLAEGLAAVPGVTGWRIEPRDD